MTNSGNTSSVLYLLKVFMLGALLRIFIPGLFLCVLGTWALDHFIFTASRMNPATVGLLGKPTLAPPKELGALPPNGPGIAEVRQMRDRVLSAMSEIKRTRLTFHQDNREPVSMAAMFDKVALGPIFIGCLRTVSLAISLLLAVFTVWFYARSSRYGKHIMWRERGHPDARARRPLWLVAAFISCLPTFVVATFLFIIPFKFSYTLVAVIVCAFSGALLHSADQMVFGSLMAEAKAPYARLALLENGEIAAGGMLGLLWRGAAARFCRTLSSRLPVILSGILVLECALNIMDGITGVILTSIKASNHDAVIVSLVVLFGFTSLLHLVIEMVARWLDPRRMATLS